MKINKIILIILVIVTVGMAVGIYFIYDSSLLKSQNSDGINVNKTKVYSEAEKNIILDSLGETTVIDNEKAQDILKKIDSNSSYSHDERIRIINQL